MSGNTRFIAVLFGPLGDTLMALALFDDIVRTRPDAELVILARRGARMARALAAEYKGVRVVELPTGLGAVLPLARVLMRPGATLLMLGLSSAPLSAPLRAFLRAFALVPGNKSIGFYDPVLDTVLEYRVSERIYQNFRRMLPHALPEWKDTARLPSVRLPQAEPPGFPFRPGAYAVFHLFGTSIRHALPPERWRTLLEHARKAHPGLGLVLTGTAAERGAIAEASEGLAVHIATSLSMSELAWVIANAALYVGIDTGVTHVAGVLGQKSVIVRHCSDPSWVPDYNPRARVVYNAAQCNPGDPRRCLMIEEGGRSYRRCAFFVSDELLRESFELALSSPCRTA